MQVNGPERWKLARKKFHYTDLLQVLKGEPLSSVFSSDGTLFSASAAPHRGGSHDNEYITLGNEVSPFFFFFSHCLTNRGKQSHATGSDAILGGLILIYSHHSRANADEYSNNLRLCVFQPGTNILPFGLP